MMESPNPTKRETNSHLITPSTVSTSLQKPNLSKDKPNAQFTMGDKIGEGTFGIVRIANHILTGERVAIKMLDKTKIRYNSEQKRLDREIAILKLLHHNNIAKLYSVINTNYTLYLVQEYANGKELLDYITDKRKLNETEACKYFQQLISGVEYMHKMGVAHRDLKPENLLLTITKEIKIIDFGLSSIYNKGDLLSTACGSPSYAAPEMLSGKQYKGIEVDIWSCGAVLYMMLTGKLAFEDENNILLFKKIISGKFTFPEFLSRSSKDLIKRMLEINPKKRISISDIKKHPWFNFVLPTDNVHNGIDIHNIVMPIDDEIVSQMEKYGYEKNEVKRNILLNEYNYLTTTYYLLLRRKTKKGIGSVSDCKSILFEEYIHNENNLLSKYNGDINEVIKERAALPIKNTNEEVNECNNNNYDDDFVITFKLKQFIKPTKVCRSSSAKHKNRFIKDQMSPGNEKDLAKTKMCILKRHSSNFKNHNTKNNIEHATEVPRIENTRNSNLLSSNITHTNTNNNSMKSNDSFRQNKNSSMNQITPKPIISINKKSNQFQCKLSKKIYNENNNNISDSRNNIVEHKIFYKKKVNPLTEQYRCASTGNKPKINITSFHTCKNSNKKKIVINKNNLNDIHNKPTKSNSIKMNEHSITLFNGMFSPKDVNNINITQPSLQLSKKLTKVNSVTNIKKEDHCKPNEIIGPFSLMCLFDKSISDMKEYIRNILMKQKIKYYFENKKYKFICEKNHLYEYLKFKIEIHKIQECNEACYLKFHRIKGNVLNYKRIIKNIFMLIH